MKLRHHSAEQGNAIDARPPSQTIDSQGSLCLESNAPSCDFSYAGREFDSEIPLEVHHIRHFDPTVGQWLSEDPVGFEPIDDNIRYVKS